MNKIKEIAASWITSINPTQEEEARAKKRVEVCKSCEFKTETVLGDLCSICYCPLKGKIYSPENSCPKGKWKY